MYVFLHARPYGSGPVRIPGCASESCRICWEAKAGSLFGRVAFNLCESTGAAMSCLCGSDSGNHKLPQNFKL